MTDFEQGINIILTLHLSNLKRVLRQVKYSRNGIWTQVIEYQRLNTQRVVHQQVHAHNKVVQK